MPGANERGAGLDRRHGARRTVAVVHGAQSWPKKTK
jgi:hypothetical protein